MSKTTDFNQVIDILAEKAMNEHDNLQECMNIRQELGKPINLPLYDSSHIGDAIINAIDPSRRDNHKLKTAIHQLKELINSGIQGDSGFDEDKLIECLFARADADYANRERQQVFPLSNGKTYAIRITEVIDNTTGEERAIQNNRLDEALNPYLVDRKFGRATLCCCEEFLEWVKERIEKPEVYGFSPVSFPYEMIHSFVQDLSATELISGFCESTAPRKKQSFTLPFFVDIENLAFFNLAPNNPTKEMLSIFALRQMLESWFMRVVGFRGITPIGDIDIRSGRFQKLIEKEFEANFRFKGRPVSFQAIHRIYQWTQASIHWAYSTNIWLVWKAMTYCERLFGATIELSALEGYRTEVIKLCINESKFVKSKQPSNPPKDRPSERTIYFRDPDIGVEDKGRRLQVFDVDEKGCSRLERNVIIRNLEKQNVQEER